MPTLFLRNRNPDLREKMEAPDCDETRLFRTYDQFVHVNRAIAGWRRIYKARIRPALPRTGATLLDIGCGGGDVSRLIGGWASDDGIPLGITAIEPDARAIKYLNSRSFPSWFSYRQAFSHELVAEGRNFDVVLSNHLLHHLLKEELLELLADSTALATRLAVHNDIRRDDFAYAGFAPTRLIFRRSFITEDGLTSIRRSYLPGELRQLVPPEWRIIPMALFRNLLIWKP